MSKTVNSWTRKTLRDGPPDRPFDFSFTYGMSIVHVWVSSYDRRFVAQDAVRKDVNAMYAISLSKRGNWHICYELGRSQIIKRAMEDKEVTAFTEGYASYLLEKDMLRHSDEKS